MSLFFCLITFAINLCHENFVTANVAVLLVNNQHGIQQRIQDFDKKFVFEGCTAKRSTDEFQKWTIFKMQSVCIFFHIC